MPSLSAIRGALARPAAPPQPPSKLTAAVAMALAGPPDALELCFILRATRQGDRWSGQMAFPGGKAEAQDDSAEAAAIREAHEEVGLELHRAESLGALPPMPLRPTASGMLAPFAFYVGPSRPPLVPNPGEVARTYWLPLTHLWDPANRGTIDWPWQGKTLRFPGIKVEDQIIWGLTYRVLAQWSELLEHPLPGADEQPYQRVR
ncbi:MAG: CoA pyrophosphatase [Nannocystaceae bacterium]